MTVRYTEDRVINHSTDDHPGPWIGKQRVYQTKDDRAKNIDWYHVRERIYDANGQEIPEDQFIMTSGLCGTKEWLQLGEEPILVVKKMFY